MSNLDLIITLVIALPAFFGFRKGFLKSFFSLAGFVIGLVLATRYTTELSGYFRFLKVDDRVLTVAAFIMIMLIVYSILSYFAGKISGINIMTKSVDRILGAVFGAFKGLIAASLILIVTTRTFSLISDETIKSSRLYAPVAEAAPATYNFLLTFIPGAKSFYGEFEKSVNSIVK